MSESIKTIWRFGYFKLFDDRGSVSNEADVYTDDGEWRRLFWRFYWKEA